MPSISLDGFGPLKRDENFYLWLALRLAIGGMRGMREMREMSFPPYPLLSAPLPLFNAHASASRLVSLR
ncbi:hypothetical protein LC605_01940 [Nostoc sp. CHAB 5836]|nr:hypothetical protein [Nostoc sp. CHAB 5836]